MTALWTWLGDTFCNWSPPLCGLCGTRLNSTERKVCGACLLKLPYIEVHDFRHSLAARLFWAKFPVERAHSHLYYRHDAGSHRLLMQLKYNHRPDLARWMGRVMAGELWPKGFFDGVDCIVAVPLHWRRRWHRGYNQSLELAKGVAEVTGLPVVTGMVRRVRNNASQTGFSTAARIENVRDLFRAQPGLSYRHILLVDDVLTTGATLTACAQAILAANPRVVFSVLTIAKA